MNTIKSKIYAILVYIFIGILIIAPFLSVFLTGILLSPQYADTYYGQLAVMVDKLKNTEGRKVVVVGNSAVAFGVDSALMERLLKEGSLDYKVVNFGLYGALGTKMMLDLSEEYIGEGDLVVFAPELNEQSLSTYFSAEHAWYAIDSNFSLFSLLDESSKRELTYHYFGYVSGKFKYSQSGKAAQGSGVYAKSSFDENGDLKNYERANNVMINGVDVNNLIPLEGTMYSLTFVDYVNAYAQKVEKKGASMYYAFAPMNAAAVVIDGEDCAEKFYDSVEQAFNFPIMSDLSACILESGWFYDSNVHLNSAGMTLYTVNLVNDIKNMLGNTTKTECVIPEMPILPQPDLAGEGDNRCADMFVYEQHGNYYVVTGLTEKGKNAKELVIPYQVDGLYIQSFTADVFRNNKVVERITVQGNIKNLSDRSFYGCENLRKLVLKHTAPSDIAVGYYLLDGAESCQIYVEPSAIGAFKNNYFWGRYAKQLQME